jgi:hypothetical protein
MMDNCTYNKTKLLHEMAKLTGFIEKYAKKDAKSAKHGKCSKMINDLHKDLKKHMDTLSKALGKAKY